MITLELQGIFRHDCAGQVEPMDAYCKKDCSGLSPDQNQLLVQHHTYNYLHHPPNYQAGPASFQQVPQIGLQAAGLYALGGIGPGTLKI